ncbi:MAG: PilZ domain-containing protein [Deltaproteobacteria bacterium]|nr:PilZ domain-containing protein [Deltaproteobacteria bacterium]
MTNPNVQERRRSERKRVIENMMVFLTIPKLGAGKIYLKDVSAEGLGFFMDASAGIRDGHSYEGHFHLNAAVKLPLKFRVVHTEDRTAGCEITDRSSKAYQVYVKFVELLDDLVEFLNGEEPERH